MPFPKRLLLDGEVVVLESRPHWWYFAGPLFSGIPVIVLLVLALNQNGDVQTAALWVTAAAALAWALWLGVRLLRWQTTHVLVTNQRLVFRAGILSKRSRDIPLDRVDDIACSQTFFERLIGAGDLVVDTEEGQEQTFNDIPRPQVLRKAIHDQRELSRSQAMGGPLRPPSVTDQIAALADLLERGAISPAEYEAKKAQLLDRL
jgi:membrane protein YdbS with pleckstrin-like domain